MMQDVPAMDETLFAFLHASAAPSAVIDPTNRIRLWNSAAETLLGWPADQVLGRVMPGIPEDERPVYLDGLRRARSGETFQHRGVHIQRQDGGEVQVDVLAVPYRANERALGALLSFEPASLSSFPKVTLQKSEGHATLALEAVSMAAWAWQPNENSLIATDNLVEIYGTDTIPATGTHTSLLHPDDAARYRERVAQAIADRGLYQVEFRVLRPDKGSITWLEERGAVVPAEDGTVERVIGVAVDITERKRVEETLREQAALLDLTDDAILVRDFETDRIQYWNRGAEDLYGFKRDEAVGRIAHDLLRTEFPGLLSDALEMVRTTGRWEGEITHQTRGGKSVIVASRWALQATPGRPLSILESNTDVTPQREALRERDEFLSLVAHDLKTPLTTISGFAQLLLRRASRSQHLEPAQIVTGLQKIEQTAGRMVNSINTFLDLNRLETGRGLELHPGPVDLVSLVQRAIAESQEQLGDRHVSSEADHPVIWGQWDAERLERVISNLLSNAIKYSPQGSTIDVGLRRADGEGGEWAILTVRDHGIGIPPGDLPRIFDRFYRAGNVTPGVAGTGIGLTGAQRIVQQHGGRIEVESREGEGSAFTVLLPIRPADGVA